MSETELLYLDDRPKTLTIRTPSLRIRGPSGERDVEIGSDATIGSASDCDIEIADPAVSALHCRIVRSGAEWILRDEGSKNGTLVNGAPIREAYLVAGAVVTVGRTQITLTTREEKVELEPKTATSFGGIIGGDRRMREIYAVLERVAPSDSTVVIEGETGTGKEVVARTIHEKSRRREQPFLVFDCSAVPENLVESELFGHEKGSFTGALKTRKGVFELASSGTVFLDELGELPLTLQPKLLRVIEQREVKRVGGSDAIGVDVRVVAATNRDLAAEVRAGRFREDLFYRLSVVRVHIPPLRDRTDDVALLVRHFLQQGRFNRNLDGTRRVSQLARGALEALARYWWPGNVRELRNAIEHAVNFTDGTEMAATALPPHVLNPLSRDHAPRATTQRPAPTEAPLAGSADGVVEIYTKGSYREAKERVVAAFEEVYVQKLLERCDHNVSAAAREADMDRKHLRRLMRKIEGETTVDDDETDVD